MFDVADNKSIQEIESEVLEFWKKNKIFEKSVEQKSADNLYVFYDGPPFISGLPHYGHLLGSIAKDVIPRYWTMKGKRVERVWGWDAHGLTVENRVQKKLNIKNRRDIENYGLEKFTTECYKYTQEVSSEWRWYIEKLGRWVDMDKAYKTIDQNYMESVIWVFKQLYDKGLIYEGVRTSLYCPTCGTPVSNFEVAMDNSYKDFEDPSIVVKFKITSESEFKDSYLLAWTTTPWTIPSNRALVLDPEEVYVQALVSGEKVILAKKRLVTTLESKSYEILKEFEGKELLGLAYEPPYTFFASKEGEFKVYEYEGMVTMEEGTGIVHSAPGFGEVDTEMGRQYGLTIMMTVDDEGKFVAGDNGINPFEGQYYAKANPLIVDDLRQKNVLFDYKPYVHRIPYHDRCNTNIIQKAQSSWFIRVADLKEDMIKNNQEVYWVPEHLKEGRFKQGVEQAPDWCISRSRFWATPMPVWEAEDGDRIVVGSIKEIEELSGKKVVDLHRPYIDEITFEKDGKVYKRRPEVLDSWMEAGSMPYAQVHYPFENQAKFELNFPGDYIVEYVAQVRAWFYVMHVLSTALKGTNSFRNVISTGVLQGNDGRKMSKTFGNYPDPKMVLEEIGGDALRLYFMNSPLMFGVNTAVDETEMRTKLRNTISPLWNSAKFFLIHANQYKWRPSEKYEVSGNVLDKWIVTRLHQTIKVFMSEIETYHVPPAVEALESFVDDLSRWYVRRSRDRISSGDFEALATLHYVLTTFAKLSAPVIPFIAEKIYQMVVKPVSLESPESVHLSDFPELEEGYAEDIDKLVVKMTEDRNAVTEVLAMRIKNNLAVRQPLAEFVSTKPLHFEDIVLAEVNVKQHKQVESMDAFKENSEYVLSESGEYALKVTLDAKLELEGKKRELVRILQGLRKEQGLSVSDKIKITYVAEYSDVMTEFSKEICEKVGVIDHSVGAENSIVAIP
ncbi:isoleucine--tRNA ligase [candidate division WWE3 bacterium RIFOXYC1_FULL_40_10]|nr:MAG: isoleucine--tRNA ligase [candidate division WWE3 bacterium RIFOXYB1_FULL_40_22]OGC61748.1 MAG: isoleucine--tRNA ligase [candidate division WWE3 bacterium RIFOXYA1_FULL_40_11]OGC65202.1 MAG: isoleucine--tRNA ligase [candidate division WWE3 bacterium RIFOXYB2_FULL_41_6]OGC66131.1 MAG: isoleucine--tRNA ligase [candidate division WWE3 bacterium RIFOXYC1_FULL_40_10]OGC67527.1 MAG: isoleucine--tRNA ligase [candidate division WWE3 bacterium RIFOXYC2_FULL_40_11]OGC70436.1 MAG: isoleucine--tRNA